MCALAAPTPSCPGTLAWTRVRPADDEPAAFFDEGHGYDLFGLEPRAVRRALRWGMPLYERYFRVTSSGIEHVPARGPAILAANHGGTLPVDGAMLWFDVAYRTTRLVRTIADRFIPLLPFVGTAFARTGVVIGTHTNVRHLLERGELVAIFPEGVAGPAKPWSCRYQLQPWRVGHAELAIRHRAPVIPVAIIGAEESWPVLLRLRGFRWFGAPYLPIPMSPVPLPFRFTIYYGPPIELHRDYPVDAADDPGALAAGAARIRDAVAALVARGLAERSATRRRSWR